MRIPKEPSILITNFLEDINEDIKVHKEVCELLKNIHRKSGLTYRSSAKIIGINETSYRRYVKGEKNVPLKFFKKLVVLDRKIIDKLYEEDIEFTARKERIKLPKRLDPKLAYFIGYLQGDGFLGSDKKTYGFSDEYKIHLRRINQINKELFKKEGKLREKPSRISSNKVPYLEVRQKVINSYLCNVWGIPRGYKKNLKIPKLIRSRKEVMRWYLRGVFDADGTLPKNPKKVKQFFIDLSLKDFEFLQSIQKILKKTFGIKSLKLYPRKSISPSSKKISITWELRIRKHEEIRKFLKEVGFFHFNKKNRQTKLLEMGL